MSKELFGLKISGEIIREKPSEEQRPLDELRPVFEALLNDPNVVEFGWTQYTPYFNDGDVCEFGVSDPWVRTVADSEDAGMYDLEVSDTHPSLGTHHYVQRERTAAEIERERDKHSKRYGHAGFVPTHTWDRVDHECKFPETADLADRLTAIQSYRYEYAMKSAFGDHAQVTVRKDGISVDSYDHD